MINKLNLVFFQNSWNDDGDCFHYYLSECSKCWYRKETRLFVPVGREDGARTPENVIPFRRSHAKKWLVVHREALLSLSTGDRTDPQKGGFHFSVVEAQHSICLDTVLFGSKLLMLVEIFSLMCCTLGTCFCSRLRSFWSQEL